MRRYILKNFRTGVEGNFAKAALWCIGLTVIWALISLGLYAIEGSKSYFEIHAVLYFKIILAAVVFLSRYLLFGQYRQEKWLGPMIGISFLFALGGQWNEFLKEGFQWFYGLLKGLDSILWGLYLGLFLENISGLFSFWMHSSRKNGAELRQFLGTLRQDTVSLGIILTFLAGLAYYYLTSFYLLDTLFYSYLLFGLVIGAGLGFYGCAQIKINRWIHRDIASLDEEIDRYIQWQPLARCHEQDGDYEVLDLDSRLAWLQYLTLIRNYLVQMGRPRFPWQIWCSYLIFSGCILIIPYVFGLAVQVGSFK